MGVLIASIALSVVLSACTIGARALHVAADPSGEQRTGLSWHSNDQRNICVSFPMFDEQTSDVEPDSRFSGSGCSKQRVQPGGIAIDMWFGRIGNNAYQIAHAIFAAKLSGISQVHVPGDTFYYAPDKPGSILALFNVSGETFNIEPDEEFKSRVKCEELDDPSVAGGHFYLYECKGVKRSDYTSVLRTYLWPHLTDEARGACQREGANEKRELVLHLRTGDILKKPDVNSRKARMAPCSFLDKILKDSQFGSFDRIRAITEPNSRHTCLTEFETKRITVQSESLAADACAIMHAQHLAFFSKSTFSEALSLFNPKPVTLYDPMAGPRNCRKHGTEKECPHGQAVMYCTPEPKFHNLEWKLKWVHECPIEDIQKDGLQCFD